MILRRSPAVERGSTSIGVEAEAALQKVVYEQGVPVAAVSFVLEPSDGLGSGYVMERIEGETIARKILRDDRYATARGRIARQCGEILGRIHSVDLELLPALRSFTGPEQLAQYSELYRSFDEPRPVFDLALRVLADRLPAIETRSLVHGDFRNGNFIVGPEGIRAVLDWELTHLGDPAEDLAWVCINSWRYGVTEKPVAGCGEYGELFAGYESVTGSPVDRELVHTWELFGTLKWGFMCMIQGFAHLNGQVRSVEKVAIGRRVSETEADLVRLLGRVP